MRQSNKKKGTIASDLWKATEKKNFVRLCDVHSFTKEPEMRMTDGERKKKLFLSIAIVWLSPTMSLSLELTSEKNSSLVTHSETRY